MPGRQQIPSFQLASGTTDERDGSYNLTTLGSIFYNTDTSNVEVYHEDPSNNVGWRDLVMNNKEQIDISGKLVVDGDVSFNAHLSAVDVSFQNNVDISGKLVVDGDVSFNGDLNMGLNVRKEVLLAGAGGLDGTGGAQGTASSKTVHNNGSVYVPTKAFNGTLTDGDDAWHNDVSTPSGPDWQWIQFVFPYDVIVTKYKIWPRFGNHLPQNPTDWALLGKMNGEATYQTIDSEDDINNEWSVLSAQTQFEPAKNTTYLEFHVDNSSNAYRTIKMDISGTQNADNNVSIGELAFYGYRKGTIHTVDLVVDADAYVRGNITAGGAVFIPNGNVTTTLHNLIPNIAPTATYTHFDQSLRIYRDSGDYREYQIGILGDNTNNGNILAFGVYGGGVPDPNIVMGMTREGNVEIAGEIKSATIGGTTTNNGSELLVFRGAGNYPRLEIVGDNDGNSKSVELGRHGSSGHGYLRLRNNNVPTNGIFLRGDGNSYIMGGNVGIGTTSPLAPLDVDGYIKHKNVRFSAYSTLGDVTKAGYNSPFVLEKTFYNVGSCYNAGTGIFTAPVTGHYRFTLTVFRQSGHGQAALWYSSTSNGALSDAAPGDFMSHTGGDTILMSTTSGGSHCGVFDVYVPINYQIAFGARNAASMTIFQAHSFFSGELISPA